MDADRRVIGAWLFVVMEDYGCCWMLASLPPCLLHCCVKSTQPLTACTPPTSCTPQGDERLPLRALWSCALATAPSDSSSSSPVQGGLV
jgi:hypothetical protein